MHCILREREGGMKDGDSEVQPPAILGEKAPLFLNLWQARTPFSLSCLTVEFHIIECIALEGSEEGGISFSGGVPPRPSPLSLIRS